MCVIDTQTFRAKTMNQILCKYTTLFDTYKFRKHKPIRWLIARSVGLIVVDGEPGGEVTFVADGCTVAVDVDGFDALTGADDVPLDFGVLLKSAISDGFDADDGLFKYFETVPLRFFKCLLGECNGNLIGDVLVAIFFCGD